jgi:2-C-methyl-D-erythritol 2,4-cyclodiphosphate synthase
MRIGIGFDVHRLVSGRDLILGGVKIPFNRGLEGYSDADVLTHSIMNAILGAAGLKDIGTQFPTGEPEYKDISSMILLERVKGLVKSSGFKINNIDSIIIAEQPKFAPFVDDMRTNLCRVLEIKMEQIMVKATSTDGLGFTGIGEGIAAYAVVTLDSE